MKLLPDSPKIRKTRRRLTVVTILQAYAVIWYVLLKGDPTNSLHSSALAWSFLLIIGVLGAYGLMANYDKENDS